MIAILIEVTLQLTINDWLQKFYALLSWMSADVYDIIMSFFFFFNRKKTPCKAKNLIQL